MNWSERETETSGDIREVKAQHVSSVTWLRPPREDPAAYMRLSEDPLGGHSGLLSSGSHGRKRSYLRQKGLQKGKNIRSKGMQVNSLRGKFIKVQTACLCWRIKCERKAEVRRDSYSLSKQGSAWAPHRPKDPP